MSSKQGACVVAWLERGGLRFLKGSQPHIYDVLLLHVGATDTLKRYASIDKRQANTDAYWHYVQVILDSFFSAAERAEMCAELIEEPMFKDDPGFQPFLHRARAELRCRDLILIIEATASIRATLRSVG